jgi:general secretion pathway protein E
MNQTPFTPAMIQKAQIASKRSGRKVLSELEDIAKLDVRQVVQSVAGLLGWRVIETYEMFKLTPAFDLLPLSKAMQRNCLLMRHDTEGLLGIMADPFDTDLSMWLEVQARAPISYRLSLSSDIAAYISKTESSAKALDHMVADSQAPAEDGKRSSQLSFASASESTSPAVKLVNST